ncbi:YveK family protein [Listeria kieliensis]|uniref:Capsular biosynthesis protein n=1 Tax=Listeria kieliensis TaxID=1621700 RepID=A0A3D8TLE3_9LIST|nr:Wzz/FepE/Etk N-terminal domain-containing protein [Listeria kieliensis]RDW99443.1 capsular biosynthesis protein [Listeria kieliensis]
MSKKNVTVGNLFQTVKKNILWIVLILLVAQMSVWVYQKYIHTDEYQAETSLLINVEQKENELYTQEGIRNSIQLITTYSSVLKSSKIMALVNTEEQIAGKDSKGLASRLSISSDQNSLVFHITYTDQDQKQAKQVSQAYVKTVEKEIPKLFKGSTVIVLEQPSVRLISQGISMNLIALFVSTILATIFILLMTFTDRTIKSQEQITLLNITYLGDVPEIKD